MPTALSRDRSQSSSPTDAVLETHPTTPSPPPPTATAASDRCDSGTELPGLPGPVRFEGCDYHDLSHHPRVLQTIAEAARATGDTRVSTSASRTTTGDTPIHRAMEADLRAFLGTPAVLLCPDGYTANLIAFQALVASPAQPSEHRRPGCVILEPDAHASLHDAARLAGLPVINADRTVPGGADAMIAHALETARRDHPGPILWASDGVFTAHGRVAPADRVLGALGDDDLLLIDDCHGFTVLGPMGRGTPHARGIDRDPRLLLTSTLAKGLGTAGGFIAGPAWFIEAARAHSDVYIGTTPTSPLLIHAGRTALSVLRDEPERFDRMRANIDRLHAIASHVGIATPADAQRRSQILAFTLPPEHADAFDADAKAAGYRIPRIRYPGGPSPEYHRLAVRATHTSEQFGRLAELLADRPYL